MIVELSKRVRSNEKDTTASLNLIMGTIELMEELHDKYKAVRSRNEELEERVKALENTVNGESWKYDH